MKRQFKKSVISKLQQEPSFQSVFIPPKKKPPVKRKRSTTKLKLLNRRSPTNKIDDIRLKAFRQLQKKIRGSINYLIRGIKVTIRRNRGFLGGRRAIMTTKKPPILRTEYSGVTDVLRMRGGTFIK